MTHPPQNNLILLSSFKTSFKRKWLQNKCFILHTFFLALDLWLWNLSDRWDWRWSQTLHSEAAESRTKVDTKRLPVSIKPQRVWTVWISSVPVIWLQFRLSQWQHQSSPERLTVQCLTESPTEKRVFHHRTSHYVSNWWSLQDPELCRDLYHKASSTLGDCDVTYWFVNSYFEASCMAFWMSPSWIPKARSDPICAREWR